MSITKNALLRYKTLDRCFQNVGRKYLFDDLIEQVNNALLEDDPKSSGINTRQLREDIRFMRSEAGYNAPIENSIHVGKKHAYYYSDPSFSIHNSPLNETEAKQLKNALELLQRFSGGPGFEWVEELNILLKDKFGSSDEKVISFESNIDYSGKAHITPLFNAIVQKKALSVRYAPFNGAPFTMNFHPHFLKQYNNRWFVFGLNELLENPTWNMALDRIKEITELTTPYRQGNINWDDYFSDIIGVTRFDGALEEVQLLFDPKRAKYVQTKPLHESQKESITEEGLLVRLQLVPNPELEQVILSFGEEVKVLKPLKLKERINDRATKMQELYSE